MGFLDRFMGNVRSAIFVETEDSATTTEKPIVSAEKLAGCEVEGNIDQTVQNMFDEALKELDESGADYTIKKVQECIDTWGEDCDSTVVLKMLRVAKIEPDVLKKDGESRVSKINGVMTLVASNAEEVFAETAKRAEEITQAINDEEMAYSTDVDALTKKCEADIKALREKLQSDISARGQLRDQKLQDLSTLKKENEQEKKDAQALKSAVEQKGNKLITYIQKLLTMLETK